MAIESIHVIGSGRVGSAVSARLRERGVELRDDGADLVLLCVPDDAISAVAATIEPGPWIAHTSGGTRLSALDPHTRRFSVHPIQTFTLERGPEQLDGVSAAISAEGDDALEHGFRLAETLGMRPFELDDADRPLYHAGTVFAASFLVTVHQAAAECLSTAGAPPEALAPLMRRTMDNGFQPTGPFVRGDRGTIERHLAALHERRPELEPLYRSLAEATKELAVR